MYSYTTKKLYQVSNATKRYFRERDVNVSYWTVHSPDLNPIEEVWNIKEMKITKMPNNQKIFGIRSGQCGTPFRSKQL